LPEAERRLAFDAAVAEKRRRAAASSSGESAFRQLLVELKPPISASSTWASVKRAVRPYIHEIIKEMESKTVTPKVAAATRPP